jgi:hypothetical protein
MVGFHSMVVLERGDWGIRGFIDLHGAMAGAGFDEEFKERRDWGTGWPGLGD